MSRADWEAEQNEQGPLVIWPEQEEVYTLFRALDTQWDYSFDGRTGFKYQVLPELWRRLRIPPERRDQVFIDLQVMERAALEEMRK